MAEHWDKVLDVAKYSTEQFDKSIVYIASGALGISFAFIKDIIPGLGNAIHKEWLITSWLIFAAVIFLGLVCHFISMLANNWAIKICDMPKDAYNSKIRRYNWIIYLLQAEYI